MIDCPTWNNRKDKYYMIIKKKFKRRMCYNIEQQEKYMNELFY